MSSSTVRFDRSVRARLMVPLLAVFFVAATHLLLEQAARFAERDLSAFLWKQQGQLQLFSAHNYVGRGRGRLLICGPSEAREAFLPDEIRTGLQGLEPYQNSQSIGTLESTLIILEYIERAYGPSAIPEAILLGVTPRFVANIRHGRSPLYMAINRYSPHFSVEDEDGSPRLVPRSAGESLRARMALLSLEPDRYRRGLFAIGTQLAASVMPSLAAQRAVWGPVREAKYLTGRIESDQTIRDWLTDPNGVPAAVRAWDANADRRSQDVFRRFMDFTERYGVRLYVVNLPQLSWSRELDNPNRYAAYLKLVRDAIGDTPFLDLRTFVPDDGFYDSLHVTWREGKRVSRRVEMFVTAERGVQLTRAVE